MIEMKFITSDGQMHGSRREANTHQRTLDARGMLENLLAITHSAHDLPDDPERDVMLADMLLLHKDNIIDLLKGKPVNDPMLNPADVEEDIAVAAQTDGHDAAEPLTTAELTLTTVDVA
jgi:hypothetical protein